MTHIGSFRKGWESENLARYFLSRFSFIANPSTISDDIGSDYYCTIFFRKKIRRTEYLIPKSFFGVQIKSNFKNIISTKKIQYYSDLHFPYFVFVVERLIQKIHIFSGEYIPIMYSHRGPSQLEIKLCSREDDDSQYNIITDRNIILNFPKIFEMNINCNDVELNDFAIEFNNICTIMQENISSRINKEYIFNDYHHGKYYLAAGSGSALSFRLNIYKRLAEAFVNLKWIFSNDHDNFNMKEFKVYEVFIKSLIEEGIDIPKAVIDYYQDAKDTIIESKQLTKS